MKTSNKFLFFTLCLTWLGIICSWIYSAVYTSEKKLAFQNQLHNQRGAQYQVMDYHKDPVEGMFTVVSVRNSGHVFVFADSVPGIVRTMPKEMGPISEKDETYSFEVKNDTLFLKGIQQREGVAYTLHIGTQIRSFVIDSVNTLELFAGRDFRDDSISISSSNSRFVLGPDLLVGSLKYTATSGSSLQAYASIKHLYIDTERSKVTIHNELEDIRGLIKDFSEVSLPKNTQEVNLKKDSDSRFYIRN